MTFHVHLSLRMACVIAMAAMPLIAHCDDLPPRYDSAFNTDTPSNRDFGTPEDDARPGEKYYLQGVDALEKKDYRFAIERYEVAASWACKPAAYNLAIMYLKGQGVAVDRARAMAWMALAAERNDSAYVHARELIYAALDDDEFAHANDIWRGLKPVYGDDAALSRAKMRMAQVKAAMTGSRVGGTVTLRVGGGYRHPDPMARFQQAQSGLQLLGAGSEDGAIAYGQFRQSNNPYDPKFEWRTSPVPAGTARVGPIAVPAGGESPVEKSGGTPDPQPRNFF